MYVTKLLLIFSCIALLQCFDEDTTYNSDKEITGGCGGPCPQYQAPKTKKYQVVELNNVKQTRYPLGDSVVISIWCEMDETRSAAVTESAVAVQKGDLVPISGTALSCPPDANGYG